MKIQLNCLLNCNIWPNVCGHPCLCVPVYSTKLYFRQKRVSNFEQEIILHIVFAIWCTWRCPTEKWKSLMKMFQTLGSTRHLLVIVTQSWGRVKLSVYVLSCVFSKVYWDTAWWFCTIKLIDWLKSTQLPLSYSFSHIHMIKSLKNYKSLPGYGAYTL